MSALLRVAAEGGLLKHMLGKKERRVYIDNVYSRMHYVWTKLILIGCAILVSGKLFLGDVITCIANEEIRDFVKQYCYIHSTFTRGRFLKGNLIYEPAKETQIHPGIRPAVGGTLGDPLIIHGYYQWIVIVLLFQAAFFYWPHWAWKKLERGTVMMLLGKLNLPMTPEPEKKQHRQIILEYLRRNRGHHEKYARFHIYTEFGTLVNLLIQMWVTNRLLDDAFLTYGPQQLVGLLQQKPFERTDKLSRLFPTVTACHLHTGGVAFGREQKDILCILPINMLSEKIYIVLWFWFLILLGATIVGGIYRVLTFQQRFRIYMLSRRLRIEDEAKPKNCAERVVRAEKYGEWFLLYKLSQNMDPITFGDLIVDVDEDLRKNNNNYCGDNKKIVVAIVDESMVGGKGEDAQGKEI